MRAMVFTRPGVVENLEIDEPVVGDDEILVTVAAAGICGSELHGITSPGFRQPPLVMGHEFAGTTSDGRWVTVNPIVSCGSCDICRLGDDQLCRQRRIIGIHRPGAFAERVAVPVSQVHELSAGVSAVAGALVEPLANGLHAWNLAGRPQQARVGIIGAGPIGLATYFAARVDTDDVDVSELSEDRRRAAQRAGARVRQTLDGEYDVIVDAVGAKVTREQSVMSLRPGGTAIWLGLHDAEPGFDAQSLIRQGKRVYGSFAYPNRTFREAVALAATVDSSWAQSFSLDEGATVFQRLAGGQTKVVKAVLHP